MNTCLEVFVSYHSIFKRKLLCTNGTHTINLYIHVDFCKRIACTFLPASVGLTQYHTSQLFDNYNISLPRSPTVYRLMYLTIKHLLITIVEILTTSNNSAAEFKQ